MKEGKGQENGALPFSAEHVLHLLDSAFPSARQEKYYKLYLFDELDKGGGKWYFLIVTRKLSEQRIDLAAFSFEIDDGGKLNKKLESRKAQIPSGSINDVIDELVSRIDEPDCDYREIDLSHLDSKAEQQEYISRLIEGGLPEENEGERG